MKLIKLSLKNFRGYRNFTISFNPNMNVIIGENDVGKSTILEALDIFFNDEAKIDVDDCNVLAEERVKNGSKGQVS